MLEDGGQYISTHTGGCPALGLKELLPPKHLADVIFRDWARAGPDEVGKLAAA